jgi:N-acetylglutamate synthase-like GNAT family acetyltransferase
VVKAGWLFGFSWLNIPPSSYFSCTFSDHSWRHQSITLAVLGWPIRRPVAKNWRDSKRCGGESDKYLVAMSYELVEATADSDWREYHSVRRRVLFERRGLTNYDETNADEYNAANHPLLLKLDGRAIGTVRLDDFGNGAGAVRLVAIAPDLQRRGHGRVLSDYVESYARRLGIKILYVNAVLEAVGYYEKLGWKPDVWNEAELVGIASGCRQMSKPLTLP